MQNKLNATTKKESSAMDYIMLMKPRVMSLVVFTGFCGLWVAPGRIHPLIAFCAILFITIGAGASAAINMWYDYDIDSIMKRTQKRPTVTGIIDASGALSFGVFIAVLSVLLMAICVNITASILLAITILYYIFIYTMWLKRSSILNVVIGGAAGALPPMIGWAAVTNDVSWQSFSLFMIIFLWTPPHSWALAIYRMQDYENCNVPMMPVIKGVEYTKKQIIIYSVLTVFSSLVPYFLGMMSFAYLIVCILAGIYLFYYIYLLYKMDITEASKKLFFASIIYLFAIFLSMLILAV